MPGETEAPRQTGTEYGSHGLAQGPFCYFVPFQIRFLFPECKARRLSAIRELYGFTRVSAFPMSDWPVLLRVEAASPLVVEDWSLKIDRASPDGKLCHFSVRGSATGEDGEGFSTNRFVSRSGRVVIEPAEWNVAYSVAVFKRALPENHVATWRATLRGADPVEPPAATPGTEAGVTVAQCLPPGRHWLELRGAYLAEQIQAARFYSFF